MALKDNPIRLRVDAYPLRFTTRILYSDMDAFRHLNNGATGRYFEEARAELNIEVFGVDCMIDPPGGLQLLLATVTVDYLRSGHYPGEAEIATGIIRAGSSSYVIAQAAFQHGACFALAESVLVKAINGRPTHLGELERAAAERLVLREG